MTDDVEFNEIGELEAVEAQQAEQVAKQEEPELPERYRGKKADDIAKMHMEAEKALSRQGQELGEIRKLADQLIQKELSQKSKKEEVEPNEVDFFENPQEAIRKAVETNPAVLQAQQYAVQARQEQAKIRLMQKHPDMQQVVQDANFAEWVKASPVRQRLLQEADAYDVDAADELLSTYKQLNAARVSATDNEDAKSRSKSLQSAGVDTGGSGETSKKIFRRADIIRLRITDPQRYDALSGEITKAYAEGRVR